MLQVILQSPERVDGQYRHAGDLVWIPNHDAARLMVAQGRAKWPPRTPKTPTVEKIVTQTAINAPHAQPSQDWHERVELELAKDKPHHARLAALCREHGLDDTGNTKARIERLTAALNDD